MKSFCFIQTQSETTKIIHLNLQLKMNWLEEKMFL